VEDPPQAGRAWQVRSIKIVDVEHKKKEFFSCAINAKP
jgi:hypothetical protein